VAILNTGFTKPGTSISFANLVSTYDEDIKIVRSEVELKKFVLVSLWRFENDAY